MKKICYVAVMDDDGWTAGIVKDGETGYYLTDWNWNTTKENAENCVDDLNQRLGLTEKEAIVMVAKSMR